jgi:hypothetical protein
MKPAFPATSKINEIYYWAVSETIEDLQRVRPILEDCPEGQT